ncbi:MAG: hypothetical protein ABRQ26_10170 [Syntrophomonadaceae bacterium]
MEIALFILLIALVAAAFGVGLFFGIVRILGRSSGWNAMAGIYAYNGPEPSGSWPRQTLMVGRVQYRNTAKFALLPEGMYLQTRFNQQALLIPWRAFSGCQPTTLYWQKAYTLTVGNPVLGSITLLGPLFNASRGYLRHLPLPGT